MPNDMIAAIITHEHHEIAGHSYYVKVKGRLPPPYTEQRRVQAVLDIASDGTLAGIEFISEMPPPPVDAMKPRKDDIP